MKPRYTFAVLAGLALVASGCSKDDSKTGAPGSAKTTGETAGGAAPFAVAIHKVERLDVVAPNQTYLDQGLGAKAPDGKTFYCVQFELKNTAKEGLYKQGAVLKIGATSHDVSMAAAGKYLPADWKATVHGKLEPGVASQESACFEVDMAAADQPAVLTFTKEKWGKHPGWKLEVPVAPAAG